MQLKKITSRFASLSIALVLTASMLLAAAPHLVNNSIPAAHAQNEVCKDIQDALGGLVSCGDDDVVSFSDFQGGLGPLDAQGSGLDSSLTRAGGNFREILVTIINFALTFLGIIAVAVVIYGGYLYVAAAGNEELSGKGKKAIMYAAIGILIIISSFAFVNTFITLDNVDQEGRRGAADGTGTVGSGLSGANDISAAAEEGNNRLQSRVFNFGASQIRTATDELLKAYQTLVEVESLATRIENVAGPTQRSENKSYLNEVAGLIRQIRSKTSSLSQTGKAAQRMLDEQIARLESFSREQIEDEDFEVVGNIFDADADGSLLQDALLEGFNETFNIPEAAREDFITAVEEIAGDTDRGARPQPSDQNVAGKIPIVWQLIGPVANSDAGTVIGNVVSTQDLEKAFAGINPNTPISELFVQAIRNVRALANISGRAADNSGAIVDAITSLQRLHIAIRDLKFVGVQITASAREGNAPFIVELSGLRSVDPSGKSITATQFQWDPDGDGEYGINPQSARLVQCGDTPGATGDITGPVVTCTYLQPGTYLARLEVESSDAQNVARGQAFLSIRVLPSLSKINLKARVGSEEYVLRSYDANNNVIDNNELAVLISEVTGRGIEFDAQESRDSSGAPIRIFDWQWGDGKRDSSSEGNQQDLAVITHKYPDKAGRYRMQLQVTDTGNRQDRKIVTILVGSIAARVQAIKRTGEPDEIFEFDGSVSRSDNGAISNYEWEIQAGGQGANIINDVDKVEIIGDTSSPALRVKFKEAGQYLVRLRVFDAQGEATTTIPDIFIKSKKPRANFNVRTCPNDCPDKTQPSLVELNASQSFDPDSSDYLFYDWKFFSAAGDALQSGDGFTLEDGGALTGNDRENGDAVKKLRVKFTRPGTYKAVLSVHDQHENANLQQSDEISREFTVNSALDAKWDDALQVVHQLADGFATVNFTAQAPDATNVEVDFGADGFSGNFPVQNGVVNFEHTYESSGSYLVTATFTSENKGRTTLTQRIYIAQGDRPLAVIRAFIDGNEVVLDNDNASIDIIRNQIINFNGGASISSTGSNSGLKYVWDFGDGKKSTGANVQHAFTELSPEGGYEVTLTVSETRTQRSGINQLRGLQNNLLAQKDFSGDPTTVPQNTGTGDGTIQRSGNQIEDALRDANRRSNDPVQINNRAPEGLQQAQETLTSTARFRVNVISTPPELATLSLEKVSAGDTTPVEVRLTAEGATDADGRITNYQFWYYAPAERERKLGVIDTTNNSASLIIDTYGESEQEREYYFCVSLTDNENTRVNCTDLFDESELPRIKVTNGPNIAPAAGFEVSPSTSVKAGREVTFTSSSTDADGRIVEYIWDVEGDGFHNNNPSESSTIRHTYTTANADGYRVKLKVIDDKGAAGYSTETRVFVDPQSDAPQGDFDFTVRPGTREVKFFDRSSADLANNAEITKWTWDFDTSSELGCDLPAKPHDKCNGDKTDDPDSTDQNPIFIYPANGDYQVKLIVEDNYGNPSRTFTKEIRVFTFGTVDDVPIDDRLNPNARPSGVNITDDREIAAVDIEANLIALSTEARMQINPDGKKILTLPANSRGSDISLCWGDSRGDIIHAWIDKNTLCDSDGDGDKTNDKDYEFPAPDGVRYDTTDVTTLLPGGRCWKTYFSPRHKSLFRTLPDGTRVSLGRYTPLLNVEGRAGAANKKQTDQVEIKFPTVGNEDTMFQQSCESDIPVLSGQAPQIDGVQRRVSRLKGSIFEDLGIQNTIILGITTGALLILAIYSIGHFFKRGNIRDE